MARPVKYVDWERNILRKCKHQIVYRLTKNYFELSANELSVEIARWDKMIRSYMKSHGDDNITLREARAVVKNLRRILQYKKTDDYFSMGKMDSHGDSVTGQHILVDRTGHYPKYRKVVACYDEFYTKIMIFDEEGNIIYEYNLSEEN